MAWLYLPDTVVLKSESTQPLEEYEPWVTLSGKATQRPLSWRGWKSRPWIKLLSGMTLPPSTASRGAGLWISSLRDSRVSRSAQQESAGGPTTSVGYGTTSRELLARYSPDGSWQRTSLDLLTSTGECSTYSGRCPRYGMMSSGDLFELTRWEPVTGERGSLYLRNWPTPTARDHKDAAGQVKDRKDGKRRDDRLGIVVGRSLHPSQMISTCGPECSPSHRRLNPAFVEWLMGLPEGWTTARIGSGPVATEWSRYKQQLQYALSQIAQGGS